MYFQHAHTVPLRERETIKFQLSSCFNHKPRFVFMVHTFIHIQKERQRRVKPVHVKRGKLPQIICS